MVFLQYLIITLKLAFPAAILWHPFLFLWLNYLLDVVDGDLLQALGMSDYAYQTIDKTTDLISYVFMLIVGLRWPVKKIVIFLFAYRLIGQLLFLITRNELYFVYFQNFLEPFLMLYTLLIVITKSSVKAHLVYLRYWVVIWMIVIAYKVWNEWYLHFANIDLSTLIFGLNGGR